MRRAEKRVDLRPGDLTIALRIRPLEPGRTQRVADAPGSLRVL